MATCKGRPRSERRASSIQTPAVCRAEGGWSSHLRPLINYQPTLDEGTFESFMNASCPPKVSAYNTRRGWTLFETGPSVAALGGVR